MLQEASPLLDSARKLEKLLGCNFNIAEGVLEERINSIVEEQITYFRFDILRIDANRVNWNQVMLNAAYRRAPFEGGSKEKGFKDALVCEAFCQFAEAAPKSSKDCLVVLVTNDGLLADAVNTRMSTSSNVRVLKSVEELRSLINTVSSNVGEDFIADLRIVAEKDFFREADKATIYYRFEIAKKIREKFSEASTRLPEGTGIDDRIPLRPVAPRFIKKDGRRVHWATRVEVEVFKPRGEQTTYLAPTTVRTPYTFPYGQFIVTEPIMPVTTVPPVEGIWQTVISGETMTKWGPSMASLFETAVTTRRSGLAVFEVSWSFSLDSKGRRSRFKVDDIVYDSTVWSED
jgi:hypothetical protein